MAHVTVTIHGRKYRMSCEAGEEAHLERLGEDLDRRVAELREGFGDIGEMQLIVMASIMLSDELAAAREKIARFEAGGAVAKVDPAALKDTAQEAVAAALNAAAERIEQVTKSLNRSLGDGMPAG